MDKINLKAEKRQLAGRKVRRLRKEGIVPANLYGKAIESISLQVEEKTLKKVLDQAGETQIIDLSVDGKNHPVLVSNIQIHPVVEKILHVDFRQVNLKEKIEAQVPVELVGESPAEKLGNTVVVLIDEVQVEALPADLPEKFEIDATTLIEVDQTILVKDLKVDASKVEIKTDPELIVIKVEAPQKEVVIEAPVVEIPEGAEVPAAEGTEKPVEGGTEEVKAEETKAE